MRGAQSFDDVVGFCSDCGKLKLNLVWLWADIVMQVNLWSILKAEAEFGRDGVKNRGRIGGFSFDAKYYKSIV